MESSIKQLDNHPTWKHVKSGKPYKIMGYGIWDSGVGQTASDMDEVIAIKRGDTYQVVPGHFAVTDANSADRAIMQTLVTLADGDRVVVYQGDYYEKKDHAFVRRYEDFFDGRFVKIDANGNELTPPPKRFTQVDKEG